jgi:hypothetical protein
MCASATEMPNHISQQMLKPQTVTQQMVRDWLKKVEEVE